MGVVGTGCRGSRRPLAVAILPGLAWLVLATASPVSGELIFADGFEAGSTCAWSSTVGHHLPYLETFDLADTSPWPAPWVETGNVGLADVQGGMARFRPMPTGYSLARLDADVSTRDAEVRFTVVFEDVDTQGVGFYVRQNGGYLDQTVPAGQGYAVFVEGFRDDPGIGVWREIDGHEQPIQILFDSALNLQNGVPYRVRFRALQEDAFQTRLQAKVWPVAGVEPEDWHVDTTDASPELQNLSGGLALDSWSSIQNPNPIAANTFVDDVEVTQLCSPQAALGAVETVSEAFQFTEGPLWRGDHLLFSDIDADSILRLDEPAQVSTFRQPSSRSNGLAEMPDGRLLAAEHEARRISITQPGNVVQTLAETYQGLRFNSPNDLAVRSDGTIYFTDPDYGLADPGNRELGFHGLFRREPGGFLHAEWMGVIGVNQPNGVALSPDETVLYLTDSQTGRLLAFDVAAGGALSNERTLAEGMNIPDGMCVDRLGNVYVATWDSTLELFDADGERWGSVAIPRAAANCAFGGEGARDLWVTAQEGLYRFRNALPGLP